MKILSLGRERGHQYRMTLDDERVLLLDVTTVEESRYTEGSEIEEAALEELIDQSATRRAREYALYLLSVRDYCEAELKRKLREKGHDDKAESTAARMVELGLVNDEVYARRLARDCRLRKLYARRRTMQELCLHGISKIVAEVALDEVDESENITDLQQALALLQKKRYNTSVTEALRLKGSMLLQRNGYDSYVVRQAWRTLTEEETF